MVVERLRHFEAAQRDERGWILNVLETEIKHVSVIFSKKGAVRGNHFHKVDTQYLYVVSGGFESRSTDVITGQTRVITAVPGDLVKTPPKVAHTETFIEDTVLVAMYTTPREAIDFSDTFKYPEEASKALE